MDNICYIFAAGDFRGNIENNENDLIIAADAGYHHLTELGLSPDILIGDFDTIGEIPNLGNIKRFPAEKDYTDTELAIIEGIQKGYKNFIICGALGGKRLEHTVANLTLASSYAQKGFAITLTDGEYYVKAIHNSTLEFNPNEKGFISVFTLSGKADGVNIKGLKYNLSDAVLDSHSPTLGVSNEFIGEKSSISVTDGTLIIIWQKKEI